MTLESWLQSRAGLAGKKLQLAVKAVEDNCVESVSELRLLAKDETQFKETFPQSMIRTVILAALTATEGDEPNVEDQDPKESATSNQEKDDDLALPSGFRFHYFVSHRKNHSKHDNVTEIQVNLSRARCFGDLLSDLSRRS